MTAMTLDETVDALLLDYQDGHSDFQITHFIVGAEGPTLWGMYQQAARELRKRRDILADIDLELELAQHARSLWAIVGALVGWLWRPVRVRAIRSARRHANLVVARDSTRREFAAFLGHAKRLHAQLGNGDRSTLEAQRWHAKGRALAVMDLHLRGTLSDRTQDFLMSLPPSMGEAIMGEVRAIGERRPRSLGHGKD